jgi:hypothetical protein
LIYHLKSKRGANALALLVGHMKSQPRQSISRLCRTLCYPRRSWIPPRQHRARRFVAALVARTSQATISLTLVQQNMDTGRFAAAASTLRWQT